MFFAALFGVVVAALLALRRLAGALTFADAAVSTFIILMTFNLVDLLLLDWLLVETIRPGFITFPGVTGATANPFGGYAYHFRGFFIGTGLSLAAAIVLAAVAVVVL